MIDWARSLWEAQVQVAPVLLGLAIIELPAFFQRRARFAYVPIYFAVFPLAELNKDLSVYLGEDFWYGESLSETGAEDLRRRIMFKAMLSMAIAALGIPLMAGFVGAFFLTAVTLAQLIAVALLLKLWRILRAIRDFPTHANGTARNRALLAVIYFLYLGVFAQMLALAYRWTRPFVSARDWSGLATAVSDLLFTRVTAQAIVLSLLTAAFISLIADRKLREENVASLRGPTTQEHLYSEGDGSNEGEKG